MDKHDEAHREPQSRAGFQPAQPAPCGSSMTSLPSGGQARCLPLEFGHFEVSLGVPLSETSSETLSIQFPTKIPTKGGQKSKLEGQARCLPYILRRLVHGPNARPVFEVGAFHEPPGGS